MTRSGDTSRISALRRSIRAGASERGISGAIAGAVQSPVLVWAAAMTLVLVLGATVLAWWARTQPMVADGRVMTHTATVRVPIEVEDTRATDEAKEAARQRTPRVYVADTALLDEIQTSLENLPRTLGGVEGIDQVDAGIREQLRLSQASLAALQAQATDGEPRPEWTRSVAAFMDRLRFTPILDKSTFQRAGQEGAHAQNQLVLGTGERARSCLQPRDAVLPADDAPRLAESLAIMAEQSGLAQPVLRDVVVARVLGAGRPTYRYDAALTATAQSDAADAVAPVIQKSPIGQVIFRRGEVLSPGARELYEAELRQYLAQRDWVETWLQRAGVLVLLSAVGLACATYLWLFARRVRTSPEIMTGVLVVMLGAFALAVAGMVFRPAWSPLLLPAPTLLASVVLLIAFDQRVAMAIGSLHALMVCIALDLPAGDAAVMISGVGMAVWQLRELRDRRSLLRSTLAAALGLAIATMVTGFAQRLLGPAALRETLIDAAVAGAGGLMVGATVLFALPLVERVFDVATGLTLIELRDSRHPLLRELQRRAPGTYTHSLNVASICESAAESIGADPLLAYVGALYHDVGKMNKPEYFVENQTGGPNKHDKLSPAMSLLIIVGHVKDGLELANEFGLPKALRHFIESHHGTTLVEFFYHRARQQALAGAKDEPRVAPELEDSQVPDEFEYRYPGPRPASREAAILMIADAVESTARTLDDPTPSRIEALVHAVANKRLLDGQFDDCDLTFKDLGTICESVSRSVASLHHTRVVYPGAEERRA